MINLKVQSNIDILFWIDWENTMKHMNKYIFTFCRKPQLFHSMKFQDEYHWILTKEILPILKIEGVN